MKRKSTFEMIMRTQRWTVTVWWHTYRTEPHTIRQAVWLDRLLQHNTGMQYPKETRFMIFFSDERKKKSKWIRNKPQAKRTITKTMCVCSLADIRATLRTQVNWKAGKIITATLQMQPTTVRHHSQRCCCEMAVVIRVVIPHIIQMARCRV